MTEIDKLKQRLKNIGRNTTEYRMTVTEALALVKEFDDLNAKLIEKPQKITPTEQPEQGMTWDGGAF